MGRRRRDTLDDWFELWARWCHSPGGVMPGSGATMLARLIDGKGHLSGGGPAELLSDTVEERIEAAVLAIASRDELTAKVLRYEFNVWTAAGRWRDQRDQAAKALTQADKARALSVSLRTYRRRLAAGRQQVRGALGGRHEC